MLQLGSGMQTVEGVTIFPDHADENQFWYLPAHLEIARRPADDWPQFSFIKFKREATAEGVTGGGFLMFTVALTLPEEIERKVRAKIPGNARLTAVPFDAGTVECVALNLQGPGGTTATVTDAGTFTAVQTILGARVPSLFGDNHAVFSLTLSQEGATLLEAAFTQGAAPIGVIYTMTFTAMQPALDVRITADFERIYQHFSAGLNANLYYVEVAIQAGIEELVQSGAITIEVTNFSTADDKQDQEKAAIDFFTQHLLQQWFTPTLTPGSLQGGMAAPARAGGGAAVFGPKEEGRPGAATPARPGGAGGQQTPPAPPAPPPAGGTPPARPAAPTPPAPPSGGPARPPAGPVGPAAPAGPAVTGSPGVPPVASPAPGGTAAPPTPPTPATPGTPAPEATHDVFVHFVEEGGTNGVNGVFSFGYQTGDTWHDTATPPGSASQLHAVLPTGFTGAIAAEIRSLPELTFADADQLRRHATTGEGILASGQRAAEPNQAFDEITPAAAGVSSLTVRIPVTKSIVTASSPDGLVAAVFPGGRLVQPGIYDCRRISGTNDFELITPGWPGIFETPSGGMR